MKYNFQVGDLFITINKNANGKLAYISEVKKSRYSTDYVLSWIDKSGVYAKVPYSPESLEYLMRTHTYQPVTK